MATTVIRGIRILQEDSFGQLDPDTLEPDVAAFDGAADVELDVDRASLAESGETPSNPRDETKNGFYREPPDPEAIEADAGGLFRHRRGKLTLVISMEGYGDADPDDVPLTWLFGSSINVGWAPAIAAEAAQAAAAAQAFAVTSDAGYVVGGLISTTITGKAAEYAAIVEKAGSNVLHHTPAFSAEADAGGDTIRPMRTWAPSNDSSTLGASLAFRIDGHGVRTYAFGCRASSYKFTATGRRCQLTIELQCAIIFDDHATVAAANGGQVNSPPYRTGGPVLHALGTTGVVASDAIDVDDAAYPRIPGRTTPSINTWEATITCELDAVGLGMSDSVLGQSEWEVVDRAVEVKLGADPQTGFDGDFWARSKRNLVLGWGPGGAAGTGGCLMLMAGWLTDDATKRNTQGKRVAQDLTFNEGGWHGDQGAATAASNTAWRLGLVI